MNKQTHNCKYFDLMMLSGNDEDFVSCMVCGKEFTREEAENLKVKDMGKTVEEYDR